MVEGGGGGSGGGSGSGSGSNSGSSMVMTNDSILMMTVFMRLITVAPRRCQSEQKRVLRSGATPE